MKKEKYVTGLEDLKTWDFSGNEQSEDFWGESEEKAKDRAEAAIFCSVWLCFEEIRLFISFILNRFKCKETKPIQRFTENRWSINLSLIVRLKIILWLILLPRS